MSLASAVKELEQYLEQEIEAQRQLHAVIAEQERAVLRGDTATLTGTAAELERELSGGVARERIRRRLLEEFGTHFTVAPRTLTLSSIIERLGPHAGRIGELRQELREATGELMKTSRKLSSVAKYHQGIVSEVLTLLSPEGGEGALVHVEA